MYISDISISLMLYITITHLYMYKTTIQKEALNLKESKKGSIRVSGMRNWKCKIMGKFTLYNLKNKAVTKN